MSNSSSIPTVDLSSFLKEGNEEIKIKVMAEINKACCEHGFFLAVNHGVPLPLMEQAFQVSIKFYECQDEEKLLYSLNPATQPPLGYLRSSEKSKEKYENLFMGSPTLGLNRYPTNPPQFRQVMEEIFPYFSKLGSLVESILNDCLELPPDTLKDYNNDRSWDILLSHHYFPASSQTENMGRNSHKDGSTLTFVFTDGGEGLEFYKDGKWIQVVPPKGTLVINIGDTLQVLSNDKFKSAVHRVIRPLGRSRYSFAFFYSVSGEKWVEPLSQFTNEKGESPKYRGFQYKEYVKVRLRNVTHPSSNPEDFIGINHYAI